MRCSFIVQLASIAFIQSRNGRMRGRKAYLIESAPSKACPGFLTSMPFSDNVLTTASHLNLSSSTVMPLNGSGLEAAGLLSTPPSRRGDRSTTASTGSLHNDKKMTNARVRRHRNHVKRVTT